MKSRTRLLGAFLLVFTLGAACGDDDSDTKSQAGKASDAPAKAEFIVAADEICAGYSGQMDGIFGQLFSGDEPEPAAVQEGFGKVLDVYTEQIADLRAITPPKGDEAEVRALLDDGEKVVTDTRTEIASPERTMELFSSDEDPFSGWDEKMAEYGFADCAGEDPQTTGAFGGDELSADELTSATKVTITGTEYSYQGVPATLPAGAAVIAFENIGGEYHEIGLVKVKAGASLEQVLERAKVDEEDMEFIDRWLGAAAALPGERSELTVKLDPGIYGFACFIEDGSGVRHIDHGMSGSFTVTG